MARKGRSSLSRDAYRAGLRDQGELDGEQRVGLRHRGLGSIQAIQDELSEKGEPDLAVDGDVPFSLLIHQIYVVTLELARHVEVLAQLDRTARPGDERAPVSPGSESLRGVPVDLEVMGRSVVGDEGRVAEVF